MKNNNENLQRLLQQFVNESEAKQMASDITDADRLFDQHPAPAVSADTLQAVQDNVKSRLHRRKHLISEIKWISGVAAIVITTLVAGLYILYSDNPMEREMAGFIPSDSSWKILSVSSETSLAEIEEELTNLSERMDTMDNEDYEPINPIRYELMELEEIEILADNTDFWKG
jgi:predicted PurR-regulated permease PerM